MDTNLGNSCPGITTVHRGLRMDHDAGVEWLYYKCIQSNWPTDPNDLQCAWYYPSVFTEVFPFHFPNDANCLEQRQQIL